MATNEEIQFALNEQRLIVLLEDIDKGTFEQVALNADQFKKVSDAVCIAVWQDETLKDGYEMSQINVKPDWSSASDNYLGLKSIYTQEEMGSEA